MFHVSFCGKNEFNCTNGHCIPDGLTCDGKNDCGDNSDEQIPSCNQCLSTEFKCETSGQCIPLANVCNKVQDCPEGEDESECRLNPKRCESDQFACLNGLECVNKHWICDRNSKFVLWLLLLLFSTIIIYHIYVV